MNNSIRGVGSILYLDYIIKYTGVDGWVLFKPDSKDYEHHLGCFKELITAKKYAMAHFMIARPELFAKQIANKIFNPDSGCSNEWFIFKETVEKEGLIIPEEITPTNDFLISFKEV